MLVFLGDGMPQKSSSNLERTTSQSGEAAMIAGRVGKSSAENENIRPGSYLNPLNRPVRTRMPGGVAGDAEDQPPRPYADFKTIRAMSPIGTSLHSRRCQSLSAIGPTTDKGRHSG